jgi:ACS family allantoate permease-like MFS transporter
MATMEKPAHDASSDDPEKVTELSRNMTSGEGEVKDPMFIHADPNDGDEALKAFKGHEGETIVMTPEMERKLLRKIDWNLMPVCFLPSITASLLTTALRRCSVLCMASITSTRRPSHTPVSWVCRRTYI